MGTKQRISMYGKKGSKEHLFIFEPAKTSTGDRMHLNKISLSVRERGRERAPGCAAALPPLFPLNSLRR